MAKVILGVLIFFHIFILLRLIFFPYPELFIYPYLTNSGLTPYAQILDQHFPGLLFLPVNLGNLGMTSVASARLWQVGIVVLLHIFLYFTGKRLFKSQARALLVNFLFLLWQPFYEGWVLWIDSFVPLFLLPAFYFLLGKGKKNFFAAGLCLGVALLLKQVTVPLILLLVFWIWFRQRNYVFSFLLGLLLSSLILIWFVISKGIIQDFYYWTFLFNITIFAQMGRKFATLGQLFRAAPVFVLAGLFLLLLRKKASTLLLAIFFLGTLVFAYARFDFVHLQPALPFALLTLVYGFGELKKLAKPLWLAIFLAAALFLPIFYRGHWGEKVFFFSGTEKKLTQAVSTRARPGESIFAMGTTPHIYFLTQTRPPGDIFVFQFPWFMKKAQDRILLGIIEEPPKVVIRDLSATTGDYKLVVFMQEINDHLDKNYQTEEIIDGVEIMIPR